MAYPKYTQIGKSTKISTNTTGTVHYHVGNYLSELFNPLTSNNDKFKDSFDAVTRIKNVPQELFDQGYRFASLDAVFLFTKVPL